MASLEKILMPEFYGILQDGSRVSVPVRISSRCRRMILRSKGEGFEVVIPPGFPLQNAELFFQQNLEWIYRTVEKKKQFLRSHPVPEKVLPGEIFLTFTGETYFVQYQEKSIDGIHLSEDGNRLLLQGATGSFELCSRVLQKWLIRHAETTLLPYAGAIARNHGFDGLSKLRTGLQKRSWGTCNRKGTVSLNAALLFFTKSLTEYVILHEFCHLTELNHSGRFWAKLENVYPGAKEARESLKYASELLPAWVVL